MAEDGLGATKRGRGGSSLAAGFACTRGAAIGARGAPSKDGRGNFPACNALKRRKTRKCSRRPKTGWEQPTESAEGLSLAALFACARGIAIDARGALKNGMRKFSCLQRIEKARNAKIYSAAEDGLGAISQTAEAL
jgi:hypothetical protein